MTYTLEKLSSINDLGVIFDSNLTFRDHMAQKINKGYSILGIIKRNFIYIYMGEFSFILLYKSMVTSSKVPQEMGGDNKCVFVHYITIVTWCMLIYRVKSSSSILQSQ